MPIRPTLRLHRQPLLDNHFAYRRGVFDGKSKTERMDILHEDTAWSYAHCPHCTQIMRFENPISSCRSYIFDRTKIYNTAHVCVVCANPLCQSHVFIAIEVDPGAPPASLKKVVRVVRRRLGKAFVGAAATLGTDDEVSQLVFSQGQRRGMRKRVVIVRHGDSSYVYVQTGTYRSVPYPSFQKAFQRGLEIAKEAP